MLEVGRAYENRNGRYVVTALSGSGVATIRYDGSEGTASGTADLLFRVHNNMEAERVAKLSPARRTITVRNTKAYVSPVELREFVEKLRGVNCSVQLRCSPVRFLTFQHEYRMLTGLDCFEEDKEVFVKDYYKKGLSMRVAFPRTVSPPKGFNVVLPDANHHHQASVDSTSLVWELFREGFHLGLNVAKETA